MNPALLAASRANELWYAVPLIVVVSLVYAATRHEQMRPILLHALRFAMMVVGFLAAVLVVLVAVSHFGGVVFVILAVGGLGWWFARSWYARRASDRRSPSPSRRRAENR